MLTFTAFSVFEFLLSKKVDQRICNKFCLKNGIQCSTTFDMLIVANITWARQGLKSSTNESWENVKELPRTSTAESNVKQVKNLFSKIALSERLLIMLPYNLAHANDQKLLKLVIRGNDAVIEIWSVNQGLIVLIKSLKGARSNVKVLLTVFFDFNGVLHHEFLLYSRTVNKGYYLEVIRLLREARWQKSRELWQNHSWQLHHDNTSTPISVILCDFFLRKTAILSQQPHQLNTLPSTQRKKCCHWWDTREILKELNAISISEFSNCFQEWKKRL